MPSADAGVKPRLEAARGAQVTVTWDANGMLLCPMVERAGVAVMG
jgi:hypothetical protein